MNNKLKTIVSNLEKECEEKNIMIAVETSEKGSLYGGSKLMISLISKKNIYNIVFMEDKNLLLVNVDIKNPIKFDFLYTDTEDDKIVLKFADTESTIKTISLEGR